MARDAATVVLLYAFAVALLVAVAATTGIADGEPQQLEAARAIGVWFDRIGAGESAFFDAPSRDTTWNPVHQSVSPLSMTSALIWHVATSGYRWWDQLISLRLGHVLYAALSIPAVYLWLAPAWGRRSGVLAAALLLLIPRVLHQSSLAQPDAATMTSWLLVLLCHVQSRGATSRISAVLWAALSGLLYGLAVAIDRGAAVVVVAIILHTLWERRGDLRTMLRAGLIPLPATLLSLAVLGPAVAFALTPWLWNDTAKRIRPWLVESLSSAPNAEAFGTFHSPLSVVTSTPAVALFAAMLGLVVVAGPRRWRTWAGSDLSGFPATGVIVVALVVALSWAVLTPASMHASPPRWLPVMPFLCALAGLGLDRSLTEIGVRLSGRRTMIRRLAPIGCGLLVFAVLAWQTFRQPGTRAVAYAPLSGGPAWVVATGALPVSDGSIALQLVPAIDALGNRTLSIGGDAIAPAVWPWMRRLGLMTTDLRPAKDAARADVAVVRGNSRDALLTQARALGRSPVRLAAVARDGVVLVELYQLR